MERPAGLPTRDARKPGSRERAKALMGHIDFPGAELADLEDLQRDLQRSAIAGPSPSVKEISCSMADEMNREVGEGWCPVRKTVVPAVRNSRLKIVVRKGVDGYVASYDNDKRYRLGLLFAETIPHERQVVGKPVKKIANALSALAAAHMSAVAKHMKMVERLPIGKHHPGSVL
jgi:hypothetical protein